MTEFPDADETLEIDVEEVSRILSTQSGSAGKSFSFIDCREEDEFQFCHIDGATLVPLSRFAEVDKDAFGEPGQPVIVYCHHGMRSAQAATFLRKKGYDRAFSMRGGIEAWSVEIDPALPRY